MSNITIKPTVNGKHCDPYLSYDYAERFKGYDWAKPSPLYLTTIDPNTKIPERYIINKGATILFWKDGTKTIVKKSKDDKYDKRLGFLTAYFQKHSGLNRTKANKYLDNLEEE